MVFSFFCEEPLFSLVSILVRLPVILSLRILTSCGRVVRHRATIEKMQIDIDVKSSLDHFSRAVHMNNTTQRCVIKIFTSIFALRPQGYQPGFTELSCSYHMSLVFLALIRALFSPEHYDVFTHSISA